MDKDQEYEVWSEAGVKVMTTDERSPRTSIEVGSMRLMVEGLAPGSSSLRVSIVEARQMGIALVKAAAVAENAWRMFGADRVLELERDPIHQCVAAAAKTLESTWIGTTNIPVATLLYRDGSLMRTKIKFCPWCGSLLTADDPR